MVDSSLFSTIVDLIDTAEDTGVSGILKLSAVQTALESIIGEDYEKYGAILKIVIDGIVSMKKTKSIPDGGPEPTQKRQFTKLFSVIECLVSGIRRRHK